MKFPGLPPRQIRFDCPKTSNSAGIQLDFARSTDIPARKLLSKLAKEPQATSTSRLVTSLRI
eukprot:1784090-Rhodomonas_salina.2